MSYCEPVLEGIASAKNARYYTLEERAMAAVELVYRWIGAHEQLPEMVWRLVHNDTVPFPVGLISPSEDLQNSRDSLRASFGRKQADILLRGIRTPPFAAVH
ncbi:hypothetical protein ACG33_06055 [Steroidobacter denitrificans]|uniref:Uncharacterized protein n=2 Tax=Steroidobacter denitrificans TaxID=465721 RepID=A0A127F8A4_STEDE|nr:hypothetical protein ACG33_06055 [Steroidobacter denitrificans]